MISTSRRIGYCQYHSEQIVTKIEDFGTDIYHASLPAEALQNANRSKTKATFLSHLLLIIQYFNVFLQTTLEKLSLIGARQRSAAITSKRHVAACRRGFARGARSPTCKKTPAPPPTTAVCRKRPAFTAGQGRPWGGARWRRTYCTAEGFSASAGRAASFSTASKRRMQLSR